MRARTGTLTALVRQPPGADARHLVRHLRAACLLALGLLASMLASANPNYRALLVGVTDYPALRKELSLKGPRNDVERMRQVLVARGVAPQAITVLADGVDGAALPTRAAILAALEQLAATARRGDYIVLYMAGHGSQSPVPDGSPFEAAEPDGLFEIFLPRDVEGWSTRGGDQPAEVRNALYDHEIRAQVDRMSAAGAFVWAIFDACHSATLVRSGGDAELRSRQVSPADLGIPDSALQRAGTRAQAARRPAAPGLPAAAEAGGSVFFYAAQTTEVTPELMVPLGLPPHAKGQRAQGLFTHTLLSVLEGGAGMSYQQLAQQVLARYGVTSQARATPLFTGTALQSGVLGQATTAVRQWALLEGKDLRLAAGLLADIRDGSVLAILPSAVARDDEALGHARVVRSEIAEAQLQPVAWGGQPARTVAALRAGKVGRMVSPAVPFGLAVAVDLERCATPCPFTAALQQLRQADAPGRPAVPGAQIRWGVPVAVADLVLTAQGNHLWLAPAGTAAQADCTAGPAPARQGCERLRARSLVSVQAAEGASAAGLAARLAQHLHAANRAANLMRLAGTLASTPVASQLRVDLQFTPRGGTQAPVRAGERMRPGALQIALENGSFSAVDVAVFYLDSHYGITLLYPREDGANNRLESGAKPTPMAVNITDGTLGMERLLVIGVEARRHGERADFAFLASAPLDHAVVTRSLAPRGADDDVAQLLRDAGFADYATRGVQPVTPPSGTGMQVFSWQVVAE